MHRDESILWREEADTATVLKRIGERLDVAGKASRRAQQFAFRTSAPQARLDLEAIGGAVPVDSEFYIMRSADLEFRAALDRGDSIVLLKGARQMGKTSLLGRALQHARQTGATVVLTDFQKLQAAHFSSLQNFFAGLTEIILSEVQPDRTPEVDWENSRSPLINFENFLRKVVLGSATGRVVWACDEFDRLFGASFSSEVCGLLRSWHNERALDPSAPWSRLSVAITYATEAHLFISDLNQSPFNVGTRLSLEDFTLEQTGELNQRHGRPLRGEPEIRQFHEWLGGQPYLVRRALREMAVRQLSFRELERESAQENGLFSDHLHRILAALARDRSLCQSVQQLLDGTAPIGAEHFYRLRSGGIIKGQTVGQAQPRCRLYDDYLRRHLI